MKKITLLFIILFTSLAAQAQTAPNFAVGVSKSGKTINLSAYKGRDVYVDFWASWCIPCRDSFPWMNDMQARYKKNGLVIIAVNLDDNKAEAKKFLQKHPANFIVSYHPDGKVASEFDVKVMPTAYLIDKKGQITYTKQGFKHKDKDATEAKIKAQLSQR